jgi:hypothetical protein
MWIHTILFFQQDTPGQAFVIQYFMAQPNGFLVNYKLNGDTPCQKNVLQ